MSAAKPCHFCQHATPGGSDGKMATIYLSIFIKRGFDYNESLYLFM
ncbi:hypothetical protein HMPREF0758_4311 [Serratia odorifera DSM 4582]|uniref:Uncharacterized protein n=1 Tax=Serratia odorifera DSM 4582 TaxID=667129 RepID=D4E811_SEROD|nr:hypothetical protein HMPREF0758_4311 [Serratia odorifera DSM 4582]